MKCLYCGRNYLPYCFCFHIRLIILKTNAFITVLQVTKFGDKNPLTKLVVNLDDVHPDDAFSSVPYEKGHIFLRYLENTVGGAGNYI